MVNSILAQCFGWHWPLHLFKFYNEFYHLKHWIFPPGDPSVPLFMTLFLLGNSGYNPCKIDVWQLKFGEKTRVSNVQWEKQNGIFSKHKLSLLLPIRIVMFKETFFKKRHELCSIPPTPLFFFCRSSAPNIPGDWTLVGQVAQGGVRKWTPLSNLVKSHL